MSESIPSPAGRQQSVDAHSQQCNLLMARWILDSSISANALQSPHAKELFSKLGFKLPKRIQMMRTMDSLFAVMHGKLSTELAEAGAVAMTSESTTTAGGVSGQAYTAHYIDKEWNLKSAALAVHRTGDVHARDSRSRLFHRVITRWNLGTNQIAVATDTAASIIRSAREFSAADEISEQVRCISHTLQLCVSQALTGKHIVPGEGEVIAPLLRKVNAIITYFNSIPISNMELKRMQCLPAPVAVEDSFRERLLALGDDCDSDDDDDDGDDQSDREWEQHDSSPDDQSTDGSDASENDAAPAVDTFVPDPRLRIGRPRYSRVLKIVRDCVASSRSTYHALVRFLELQGAISETLQSLQKPDLMLTGAELTELADLCSLLKPFVGVIDEFEREPYPALSVVWPKVMALYAFLEGKNAEHPRFPEWHTKSARIQNMVRSVHRSMDQINQLRQVPLAQRFSTLLDPRFKKLEFLIEAERKPVQRSFLRYANQFFGQPKQLYVVPCKHPARVYNIESLLHMEAFPAADPDAVTVREVRRTPVQHEWIRYLAQSVDVVDSSDVLPWWKQHEKDFPLLATLARRFLCMPTSPAPSEHSLSLLNLVIPMRPARILPDRAECVALMRCNQGLF